jgi:hypothetical protein
MTTPDLQALIELSEKATAGPWRECGHDRGGCSCGLIWSLSEDLPVADASMSNDEETRQARTGSEQRKYNAEFIAALVNWFRANHSTLTAPTLPGAGGGDALDAARWKHVVNYGVPVRNQSGDQEAMWLAFSGPHDWHFGSTPTDAIDKAIASLPPQQGG